MKPARNTRKPQAPQVVAIALLVLLGAACGQGETTTGNQLVGTKWEMTSVRDGGVMTPANPTTIATLVFADGTASGSTGCNLFRSAYSIDGDSITFGHVGLSGSACHPDYVGQGDSVMEALQASKRFAMSDTRLELTDAGGTVQMQFRPAELLPLPGITWRLAWYGEGTSPLDGTEISLAFHTDGTLKGAAGCNDYSADYRINGAQLTIAAITHTEKGCLEPDGVMNQEIDYLNTIQQTASLTTTLTGLELLSSGGNTIAEYRFGGRIRNAAAGGG